MDNSKQAFPLPGQSGMPNQMAMNPGAMPMGGAQPMQNMQTMPMQGMRGYPNIGMQPGMQPGMNQMQMSPDGAVYVDDGSKIDLIKNIVIGVLGALLLLFLVLFFMKSKDYNELSADIDGQITLAVADAVDENTTKLELEFAEREKSPYRSFTGPEDYGALSFNYPKTWSLYVRNDASSGSDYDAFFNPVQIDPLSDDASLFALRLTITNTSFENIAAFYEGEMSRNEANLTMDTLTVNDTVANRYTGTLPGTDFNGYIIIFKIRDKTAIFETDSYLFETDFYNVINSINFNA